VSAEKVGISCGHCLVLAAHWSYVGRQATIAIILTTDGKYQDPPEFYLYLPLHFMRTSDMIMSAPAQTPENITHIQNGPARYTGQPGELVAQNERDSVRNDKKVLSRRRDETRTRRNNVVTLIIFHWHFDTCFQQSCVSLSSLSSLHFLQQHMEQYAPNLNRAR
jgi:hypothetical protein